MITSSGPQCDVCGKYILPVDPAEMVNVFTVPAFTNELHACNTCKTAWPTFGGKWTNLPDGPLRRAYAAEVKRREDALEELRCEQEELEECGDLEDRMEIAQKVAAAENALLV